MLIDNPFLFVFYPTTDSGAFGMNPCPYNLSFRGLLMEDSNDWHCHPAHRSASSSYIPMQKPKPLCGLSSRFVIIGEFKSIHQPHPYTAPIISCFACYSIKPFRN